jgi:hypothetical protein
MAACKQKLEKRVQDDFENEVFPYFKNYIEDLERNLKKRGREIHNRLPEISDLLKASKFPRLKKSRECKLALQVN